MYMHVKRAGDIGFALILLFIFSLLLVAVSILVAADSKGPVLFKQKRYGKNKQPFTIYKFRTMTVEAPNNQSTNSLVNADSYITRSGLILRKLSLDELPQLLNVLRGEMSFVGPRPVILQEADLIGERDKYGANDCLPGITGWAQANGRDEIDIFEKARLDGEYANNISMIMDIRCVLKTIDTIIFSRGYREGAPVASMVYVASQETVFYAKIKSNVREVIRPVRRKRPMESQTSVTRIDI